MPRRVYKPKKFGDAALDMIATANRILEDYAQQGYDLTLRQLYYQLVARDLFPEDRTWMMTGNGKWVRDPDGTKNAEPNYKWLGDLINDARLAGRIDWDHIVDRTRNLEAVTHWDSPAQIIEATARSYKRDLWADQDTYVTVFVEKDALAGVIERICTELDVPYLSCRGYTSQSEMWGQSQLMLKHVLAGKTVTVLHLGDHDPSGIDMSRDIEDRLSLFIASDYVRETAAASGMKSAEMSDASIDVAIAEAVERLEVRRIALTMEQVRQYDPPPNPAKLSDSRGAGYVQEYGNESWELDALDPPVLNALIREHVEGLLDTERWDEARELEDEGQALLRKASDQWDEIVEGLK